LREGCIEARDCNSIWLAGGCVGWAGFLAGAARGGAGLRYVLSERVGYGGAGWGGFAAWDFDFAFSDD
jgi:hypothetical protein